MPASSGDEDPLSLRQGGALRIALLYNLKENAPAFGDSAPPDALDELDERHNVEAYASALRAGGHGVYSTEGNADLAHKLRLRHIDICFNTERRWPSRRLG